VVYDRAWVGELQSTTPNVHVTLGTGTYPRENGFLGFGWAAPQTRRTIDFRSLLANGGIDPVLRALPVPSVAARLHALYPNAVSIAASGHKDYAAVGLGGGAATYELYGRTVNHTFVPAFLTGHAPPPLTAAQRKALTLHTPLPMGAEDRWAVNYTLDVALRTRPRLLMLNLPEIDSWGHWFGPDNRPIFTRLMQGVDADIGQIEDAYRRMGILDQTDFILTADHSMMESRPANNWRDVWKAAGGQAAIARADPDGGAIWLKDPSGAKRLAKRLVALRPTHVEAVFYRSAQGISYHYVQASPMNWLIRPAVGTALRDLADTTAGRNGPDVWMLYREGYTTVPRNVKGTWKGTHGGATWEVQHIPLVIAGPGIQQGVHSEFAARSIDIAPTMENLLGLPAIHRDGVLLADALQDPTRAQLDAQNAVAPRLSEDVSALQAQSQLDLTIKGHWPKPPTPIFRCHLPPSWAKNTIINCTPAVPPTNS
ncbi:MAG: alkaline phosphatase family protein, partial [Chloroflexota bacterium]|nr:alkaline phosphatase family protein [Chloroflexota bacterium]